MKHEETSRIRADAVDSPDHLSSVPERSDRDNNDHRRECHRLTDPPQTPMFHDHDQQKQRQELKCEIFHQRGHHHERQREPGTALEGDECRHQEASCHHIIVGGAYPFHKHQRIRRKQKRCDPAAFASAGSPIQHRRDQSDQEEVEQLERDQHPLLIVKAGQMRGNGRNEQPDGSLGIRQVQQKGMFGKGVELVMHEPVHERILVKVVRHLEGNHVPEDVECTKREHHDVAEPGSEPRRDDTQANDARNHRHPVKQPQSDRVAQAERQKYPDGVSQDWRIEAAWKLFEGEEIGIVTIGK